MTTTNEPNGRERHLPRSATLAVLTEHRRLDAAYLSPEPADFSNESIQRDHNRIGFRHRRLAGIGWDLSSQYRAQVLWMPLQRHGQGFEGARVAVPLDLALLNLAHDGERHAGAFGKLPLLQA